MLYGLGLVLGGAVGNLVDRLVRAPDPFRGAVVDWLRVSPYRPVFNIADVALRVGGVLLIVALLRSDRMSKVETATSPG
jgi:signal peptidase II